MADLGVARAEMHLWASTFIMVRYPFPSRGSIRTPSDTKKLSFVAILTHKNSWIRLRV